MTTNGGGWTLLMKISAASPAFAYDSPYWTNTATLNETAPDVAEGDAKYASYGASSIATLRVTNLTRTKQVQVSLAAFGGSTPPTTAQQFFSLSSTSLSAAPVTGDIDYVSALKVGTSEDCAALPDRLGYSGDSGSNAVANISYRLGTHGGLRNGNAACVRGIGLGGWAGGQGATGSVLLWGK
jgi:hypothetical protein